MIGEDIPETSLVFNEFILLNKYDEIWNSRFMFEANYTFRSYDNNFLN